MYYAKHNTRADLNNGNHGFLNTWVVSRFKTRKERDSFVVEYENQLAEAVTRKEAEATFRGGFECVGKPVPRGGLFGPPDADFWKGHNENFWNENFCNEYANFS